MLSTITPCVTLHGDWEIFAGHQQHTNQFLMAFHHKISAPLVFMLTTINQLLWCQSIQVACFWLKEKQGMEIIQNSRWNEVKWTYPNHNWDFTHGFIDRWPCNTIDGPSNTNRASTCIRTCPLPTFRWINLFIAGWDACVGHLWLCYCDAFNKQFNSIATWYLKFHRMNIFCTIGQTFVQHIIKWINVRRT